MIFLSLRALSGSLYPRQKFIHSFIPQWLPSCELGPVLEARWGPLGPSISQGSLVSMTMIPLFQLIPLVFRTTSLDSSFPIPPSLTYLLSSHKLLEHMVLTACLLAFAQADPPTWKVIYSLLSSWWTLSHPTKPNSESPSLWRWMPPEHSHPHRNRVPCFEHISRAALSMISHHCLFAVCLSSRPTAPRGEGPAFLHFVSSATGI